MHCPRPLTNPLLLFAGFPGARWYVSFEELSDQEAPYGVPYVAGWGYIMSRDVVQHALGG